MAPVRNTVIDQKVADHGCRCLRSEANYLGRGGEAVRIALHAARGRAPVRTFVSGEPIRADVANMVVSRASEWFRSRDSGKRCCLTKNGYGFIERRSTFLGLDGNFTRRPQNPVVVPGPADGDLICIGRR